MKTKRKSFKKRLLATSISCGVAATSQSVLSQEAEVLPAEEVIVRGYASAIERSLDIKRDSKQIMEAITADDIGKMPDQNIAESLQRLPGIQIDRRDGQGTKVRIRGLDQNITLLDGESFTSGLEYFQMGEWRQEFDSSLEGVPSELLGGVEVYKSPLASLVEGGMGGVVNLKTRSAFDLKEPLLAANVKVDQGLDAEEAKPSLFVVAGNNWETFGALVSLSMGQKTVHTDYMQNFSRENTQIRCNNGASWNAGEEICDTVNEVDGENVHDGVVVDGAQNFISPGMYYWMDTEQTRDRIGASVNLQWAPSEALEFGLDIFHNENEISNISYTVKHPMATDDAENSADAVVDSSRAYGVLLRDTVTTPGTETNTAGELTDVSADNIALKMAYDNGGKLRVHGQLNMSSSELSGRGGYADSRFSEYAMRAYVGDASPTGWDGTIVNPSTPDRSYEYVNGGGDLPSMTYANEQWLANPDYHTYKSHWGLGTDVSSDTFAFKTDVEYDLDMGDLKTLSFGLRIAEEETDFTELRYMTDFSTTTGVMSPTLYNEDGSVRAATTFDPDTPPDATNAGVREAIYYDLCGNGGIPAGQSCDIDGDGLDDNQPYGPWGYFLDAAIGLKAYELQSSNGTNLGELLYGTEPGTGRWDRSPGYLPWQTYTAQDGVIGAEGDASRYIIKDDFFKSGGYPYNTVAFQNGETIASDPEAWIASIAPNSYGEYKEVPLESFTITESTTAMYAMADFEGEAIPYSLNVGVRMVETEVEVTSAVTTAESANWSLATDGWNSQGVLLTWDTVTTTRSYFDILPSLNFSLDVADSTKFRFTAAKVIARPNLQSMGKGANYNFTRTDEPFTYFAFTGGSAGNPDLNPFRATQADASVEYYFDELGLISGGVFVKAIESFIKGATVRVWGADDGPGGGRYGDVNIQDNGAGGSVSGYEFTAQKGWDNGFGASFNYTYSDNTADITTTTNGAVGLPGVSKHSANLIGFFENDSISARIAYTWRSKFVSPDRPNFAVNGLDNGATEFFNSYGQVDANITWDVIESLSLTAEVINLTGEENTSYLAYPNNPMTYASQEPRIVLGLNYRL